MTQPIIDVAVFDELQATTDADFVGELMDAYCEETPLLIAQLEQALAEGNVDVFRRAAHSIKSSSAPFGALGFSGQAKELEMLARQGHLDGADAGLASLIAAYPKVVQSLRELQRGS
jgi:histidine phosphotransfer protein HptB